MNGDLFHEIELPGLLGNREQVQALFRDQGVPDALDGEPLVVIAARLRYGSPTAADELVRAALLHRRASGLILLESTPAEFIGYVEHATSRRGLVGVVQLRKYAELAP